jgi:hypothetical protein
MATMFFMGLFIGLVFADQVRSIFGRMRKALRKLSRSKSGNPPKVQTPPSPETVAAIEPREEPLAIKLQKLESRFAPVAENAAHPREFLDQPSFQEAAGLFKSEAVPLKTVMQYVLGANWALSCAALSGLAGRPDRESAAEQVVSGFDRLTPWAMHYALAYFLGLSARPPVGAPYVNAKEWWKDNTFIQLGAQEYFDESERLGDIASFGRALDAAPTSNYPFIRGILERVNNALARQLILQIDEKQRAVVDRTFLASFGRFWGQGEKLDLLIEPEAWRDMLANAEAAVTGEPPRSLLASGEPRIGKTSFMRLLAKRLEREGWTVFEAGGADLMAGQQWFGQLEYPEGRRGAFRFEEADLVYPRHSSDRAQRHPSGTGGEHPRADPARCLFRPPHCMDRSLARGSRAPFEAQAATSQHLRADPLRAAVEGGNVSAFPFDDRASFRRSRSRNRSSLRGNRSRLGPAISELHQLSRLRARSLEVCDCARRKRREPVRDTA